MADYLAINRRAIVSREYSHSEEHVKHQVVINEAEKSWNGENPSEAGRVIFEHIPRKDRFIWAASILELACNRLSTIPSEIEAILDLAKNHNRWGEGEEGTWKDAHAIVVAAIGLALTHEDSLNTSISTLAMNVGKVVYNARWYPAPFDHNAGWEIAENLREIVAHANDPEFTAEAWSALSNEKYIKLMKPIMCNPNCALCYANGLIPISEKT
jgi:hypothetical protein